MRSPVRFGTNWNDQVSEAGTCWMLAAGTIAPFTRKTTDETPERLSLATTTTFAQPITVVASTTSFLSTPLTVLVPCTGLTMFASGGVRSTSQVYDAGDGSRTVSRSRARTKNV